MSEDARRLEWSSDKVLELALKIDGERADAQERLRQLSGGEDQVVC